jgi:hypothetical protein
MKVHALYPRPKKAETLGPKGGNSRQDREENRFVMAAEVKLELII